MLQEICQKVKLSEPVYTFSDHLVLIGDQEETSGTIDREGATTVISNPPLPNYECKCYLASLNSFAIGYSRTKKNAKTLSAKKLLKLISHIPDVQTTLMSIMMASRLSEGIGHNANG